jgi:hypothetical protein
MPTNAPGLSQFWLSREEAMVAHPDEDDADEQVRAEQEALEALTERVNAARSVV